MSSILVRGIPIMEPTEARAAAYAASLEAVGRLGLAEISRQARIPRPRLMRLRAEPWYAALVRICIERATQEAGAAAIATRAGRLSAIQRRYDMLQRLVDERGASYDPRFADPDEALGLPGAGELHDPADPVCHMQDPDGFQVPGAATGLLTKQVKTVGTGLAATVVNEFSFDKSVFDAMEALEKQAARETGQWAEKGVGGVQKLYVDVRLEDI